MHPTPTNQNCWLVRWFLNLTLEQLRFYQPVEEQIIYSEVIFLCALALGASFMSLLWPKVVLLRVIYSIAVVVHRHIWDQPLC